MGCRYLKQAVVDKSAVVASAVLVSALHLVSQNTDIVKRWTNEIQEAVHSKHSMVQFHAVALLHALRANDRLAVSKQVSNLVKGSVRCLALQIYLTIQCWWRYTCVWLVKHHVCESRFRHAEQTSRLHLWQHLTSKQRRLCQAWSMFICQTDLGCSAARLCSRVCPEGIATSRLSSCSDRPNQTEHAHYGSQLAGVF